MGACAFLRLGAAPECRPPVDGGALLAYNAAHLCCYGRQDVLQEVGMQTQLGHLVFGIDDGNRSFYRDLFSFLGWQILYDVEGMIAAGDRNGVSLWFGSATKQVSNDYDGPGLNHVAISTATQADVNHATAFLVERGVEPLFETPRHRPEFSQDESSTYYQVMFETPDRLLFEIVYTGPKS
jgi:catechol 2,3-dioxygenase-like lactoylglutathione lyase family enzyme